MFQNQRFVTQGVSCEVGLLLQLFLWQLIDELPMTHSVTMTITATAGTTGTDTLLLRTPATSAI